MKLVIFFALCLVAVASSSPVDNVVDVLKLTNVVQADIVREKRQFGGGGKT